MNRLRPKGDDCEMEENPSSLVTNLMSEEWRLLQAEHPDISFDIDVSPKFHSE